MAVIINDEENLFTLQTRASTYQMKVDKDGRLLHTYYGRKTAAEDLSYLFYEGESFFTVYPYESKDRSGSLELLAQEYSTSGSGDLRTAGLDIVNSDGSSVTDLRFKSYQLTNDKYRLESLPTFFALENERVETLKIVLFDEVSEVQVELLYGIFEEKDVITRAVKITNRGLNALTIRRAQSLVLDFPYGNFDLIHFPGRWGAERNFERLALSQAKINFSSNYGTSSHAQNPGFILTEKAATETQGDCYGFNLVYSGNFLATAEQSNMGLSRVTLGLGDEHFSWELKKAAVFESPEAVMTFSAHGFEGLSHHFHRLIRQNLCRSKYSRSTNRPILINSWEAALFDFTGQKLIELAESAKDIGVDLLVMDDGWFGNRYDDNRALGDWTVNEEKLGMSLQELTERISELDLKFGIWFEPEMISEDSELYRCHPDWAMKFPNRQPNLARNQLVLDLSKAEVIDYLFEKISAVLDSADISYVKWDMNRPVTDWYSDQLPAERMGELQHRYVLNLYQLLERLTSKYQDILWEGCSSGGARFDLGMLAYQPQIWTSDNTDAINRLKIQYGTSFLYPLSAMGTHVTDVPAGLTGRVTDVQTRAYVAMAGTYGYEFDTRKLSEAEKAELLTFTKFYQRNQALIFDGDYYRLSSAADSDRAYTARQIVAPDKSMSLITIVYTDVCAYPAPVYLKLRGLDSASKYQVQGAEFLGSTLMNAGLKLKIPRGSTPSEQLLIKKIRLEI
ncbi:alpha-galactosidase [Lactovum odontotermitis]